MNRTASTLAKAKTYLLPPRSLVVGTVRLQRKCACGGTPGPTGECEECRKKKQLGLQTKLEVNEPGDIYEQEADRIADQVVATPAHTGMSAVPARIQRFSGQSTGQMDAATESVDQVLASPGMALEPALRQDMEQRFGHDFSRVRVHTDSNAAESARAVNALAYTVGRNVVFGAGQYAPSTPAGRKLIAHELTHVVQQLGADETRVSQNSDQLSVPLSEANISVHGASYLRPAVVPFALARKERLHSDEELGEARLNFYKKNDHLKEDQLRTIANAVIRAAFTAKTYEVAYSFFDYYSGLFGEKIYIMTKAQEEKAIKADRYAETDPGGNTRIRSDILTFNPGRLGAILLHELSHTGQVADVAGLGSTQEGQSYAIEYFYAEKSGDTDRMDKIVKVISTGSVTLPNLKVALQHLFKTAYAVMTTLRELGVKGSSAKLPSLDPPLTADDGELLLAEYVTHYAKPSDRLQKIIDHISKNLATYYTGPGL